MRPLAWSRIALGTLFLFRTTPLLDLLRLPFASDTWPLLGWPNEHWAGSAWFHLPTAIAAVACVARTIAAILFTLGIATSIAGVAAGTLGYLVMLQHPFGLPFTLHLLFQGTIVLAFADAGTVLAIRPERPRATASSLLLVRCFLASIYFWAGIGKLRLDWLDGRTLELFRADGAFHGWANRTILASPAMRATCAISVVVVELSLPWLLLIPRTQTLGLAVALALHAIIELAARPDLLGWEMVALLLALWPMKEPSADLRAIQGEKSQGRDAAGQPMNP